MVKHNLLRINIIQLLLSRHVNCYPNLKLFSVFEFEAPGRIKYTQRNESKLKPQKKHNLDCETAGLDFGFSPESSDKNYTYFKHLNS
jgi:hypothetical protein